MEICNNETAVTSVYQLPIGSVVNFKRFYVKSTCPNKCWKYSFPILQNTLFSYVLSESPALSLAVTVSAGDVHHILVRPLPGILAVQQDVTIPGVSRPAHAGQVSLLSDNCVTLNVARTNGVFTNCLVYVLYFEMSDKYGNNNRTDDGRAYATLDAGLDNVGTEVNGVLSVPLVNGRASFDTLRISCAGTNMRLKYSYRKYERGLDLLKDPSVIVGYSPSFTVLPAPPRIEGVYFGVGHTSLWVQFDKHTDQGSDLLVSKCRVIDSLDLFNTSLQMWSHVPSPRRDLGDLSNWPLGQIEECSWLDSRTLVISLGIGSTILPGDRLQLRTVINGTVVRSSLEVDGGTVSLTSLPGETESSSCAGKTCGGHTVNDFHSLEETELTCPPLDPKDPSLPLPGSIGWCTNGIEPGKNTVRDMEHMSFDRSTWLIVGAFCIPRPS